MTRLGLLLGVLLAGMVTGVGAHHASSGLYDNQTIGEVEVSSIFWRNPHVRITITRTGENGQEEEWAVEFGSVNTLTRIGVSRDLVRGLRRAHHRVGATSTPGIFARSIESWTNPEARTSARNGFNASSRARAPCATTMA